MVNENRPPCEITEGEILIVNPETNESADPSIEENESAQKSKFTHDKKNYGKYGQVLLTEYEYEMLESHYGEPTLRLLINDLDQECQVNSIKFKSYYNRLVEGAEKGWYGTGVRNRTKSWNNSWLHSFDVNRHG